MLTLQTRIDRAQRLLRMLEQDAPLLTMRVAQLSPERQESAKSYAAKLTAHARAELERLLPNWARSPGRQVLVANGEGTIVAAVRQVLVAGTEGAIVATVPERTALVEGGYGDDARRWTYAELLRDAEACARALLSWFHPGESITRSLTESCIWGSTRSTRHA